MPAALGGGQWRPGVLHICPDRFLVLFGIHCLWRGALSMGGVPSPWGVPRPWGDAQSLGDSLSLGGRPVPGRMPHPWGDTPSLGGRPVPGWMPRPWGGVPCPWGCPGYGRTPSPWGIPRPWGIAPSLGYAPSTGVAPSLGCPGECAALGHTCPRGTSCAVSWLRCWQKDLLVAQAWTLPRRGLALEAPRDVSSGDTQDTLPGTGWLEMVCPVSDDQVGLTLSGITGGPQGSVVRVWTAGPKEPGGKQEAVQPCHAAESLPGWGGGREVLGPRDPEGEQRRRGGACHGCSGHGVGSA